MAWSTRQRRAGALGLAGAALLAFAAASRKKAPARRGRCGIHGPVASDAVKKAILDAWASRGYPRAEASRAVMQESGWHPEALACGSDGHPVAGGLVQMLKSVLHHYGFSGDPADFAGLSGEDQAPYIIKMIKSYPTWGQPGDSHLVLAAPGFIRASNGTIVYDVGTAAWQQNPGLREPGDGPITAGSIRRTVA